MLIYECDHSCEGTRVSACECVTIRLVWRTAAAEPHDDGSKSEASLDTVLPDAFQDVEREVDVQITEEHDAVTILQEETHTEVHIHYMYKISDALF